MKKPQPGRGPSGFTLMEMLVAMAILMILMLFAVPAFRGYMRQGNLRGIAGQTATLMRLARLEAIKRSCPAIVKIVEANPPRMEGFPDCDRDCVLDADKRTLGTFPLPTGVRLLAPPDLEGEDSIDFPPRAECGDAKVAVFQPDGSIEDRDGGGFYFGDDLGNFLRVRVEYPATARVEVQKCRLCTGADLDTDWYASGDGGEAWTWN